MPAKKKTTHNHRSSVTGRYVKASTARRSPRTHEREKRKK
jgi:hypothetical protein